MELCGNHIDKHVVERVAFLLLILYGYYYRSIVCGRQENFFKEDEYKIVGSQEADPAQADSEDPFA